MPWAIEQKDGEYLVIRENGKIVGRHPSRKKALAHQAALYAIEADIKKARERKFQSRAEAARYAAQIRWGNRGGAQATAATKPAPGAAAPSDPLAARINEGTKALTDAGFTVEVLDSESITADMRNELDDKWNATFSAMTDKPTLQQKDQFSVGSEAIQKTGKGEGKRVLIVARDDDGNIAGVANMSLQGDVAYLSYMATTKLTKGTGSALFGQSVKSAIDKGFDTIRLQSLPGANSFWREMGFVPVAALKRPMQIMERGKLKELAGQLT
jgi:hypothetical protein